MWCTSTHIFLIYACRDIPITFNRLYCHSYTRVPQDLKQWMMNDECSNSTFLTFIAIVLQHCIDIKNDELPAHIAKSLFIGTRQCTMLGDRTQPKLSYITCCQPIMNINTLPCLCLLSTRLWLLVWICARAHNVCVCVYVCLGVYVCVCVCVCVFKVYVILATLKCQCILQSICDHLYYTIY